jgi:hypothetical protein
MEMETDKMNASESLDSPQRHMCNFLKKPFPECYCMHMSSMNIPKILEFCAGEFTSCLIYRRHTRMITPWRGTHPTKLCHQNA